MQGIWRPNFVVSALTVAGFQFGLDPMAAPYRFLGLEGENQPSDDSVLLGECEELCRSNILASQDGLTDDGRQLPDPFTILDEL